MTPEPDKNLNKQEALVKYEIAVDNIVRNCMRLQPADRLVIVTDRDREDIGQAISAGAEKVCPTKLVLIEDFVERPATSFPDAFAQTLTDFKPTASIYAATGKKGELQAFRMKLMDHLTKSLDCRHGHMIGVNEQIMLDGMSKDYAAIGIAASKLHEVLKGARQITVTDPHGTTLAVALSDSPNRKWKIDDGVFTKPGDWGNLPAGEIFTCPETANGVVVAWELGDYFSEKYGVLDTPIIITVKDGRVSKLCSENMRLVGELEKYLNAEENGNRMGEFAVGCLLGLDGLIGNLLQDEKYPGIHMAFGHPYPKETGQMDWDADSHIDIIPLNVNASVDGKQILKDGKFTVDLS
jgi:leucyl aminopeptidase (aminopeptidase T)